MHSYNPRTNGEAPFWALPWGEDTNSTRLFTSIRGKESIRKSKVVSWVDLLTDLKNMVVCQEWNKQDFNFQNVYLENLFMQ
jgi:hypothetical protein